MGRVTRAGNGGTAYKSIPIKFIKPIRATITSRFGSRWGSTHKGLDYGAPTGTAIKAAAEGTVTFSGWNSGGYGYLVIISHGNGVQTYYGHCSVLTCKVGDYVTPDDVIAKVGNTGDSQGSHLHFEIRVNDVAYNPEYYLK
ncbi:MAG: M23 family metallopeptidase [Clostridia bacterium]|nr:M23 family metallopeptidase [Clostridia bacterium]